MDGFERIGTITEGACEGLLASIPPQWGRQVGPGMDYWQAYPALLPMKHPELTALIPSDHWVSVFVIRLEEEGRVQPHRHVGDVGKHKYNVVLTTNDDCISRCGPWSAHLERLGVYRLDSRLEHGAYNGGWTPRIHLVISARDWEGM